MSTDPASLAREVLEAQAAFDRDAEDAAHYGEVCDRLNEVVDRAAPALARAALRVEALADRLENEAAYKASRGDTWDAVCLRSEADRIRTALNGGDA